MEELKTLKDLRCAMDEEYSCCGGDKSKHTEPQIYDEMGPWSFDHELRQEAIKRIKIWKSNLSEGVWCGIEIGQFVYNIDYIRRRDGEHTLIGMISCFVAFFNITNEDINE